MLDFNYDYIGNYDFEYEDFNKGSQRKNFDGDVVAMKLVRMRYLKIQNEGDKQPIKNQCKKREKQQQLRDIQKSSRIQTGFVIGYYGDQQHKKRQQGQNQVPSQICGNISARKFEVQQYLRRESMKLSTDFKNTTLPIQIEVSEISNKLAVQVLTSTLVLLQYINGKKQKFQKQIAQIQTSNKCENRYHKKEA
eukprot:403347511